MSQVFAQSPRRYLSASSKYRIASLRSFDLSSLSVMLKSVQYIVHIPRAFSIVPWMGPDSNDPAFFSFEPVWDGFPALTTHICSKHNPRFSLLTSHSPS